MLPEAADEVAAFRSATMVFCSVHLGSIKSVFFLVLPPKGQPSAMSYPQFLWITRHAFAPSRSCRWRIRRSFCRNATIQRVEYSDQAQLEN